MPQGPGTYGSQRGRPPKKKKSKGFWGKFLDDFLSASNASSSASRAKASRSASRGLSHAEQQALLRKRVVDNARSKATAKPPKDLPHDWLGGKRFKATPVRKARRTLKKADTRYDEDKRGFPGIRGGD